jgi:hypothetical protein
LTSADARSISASGECRLPARPRTAGGILANPALEAIHADVAELLALPPLEGFIAVLEL